tara:strand:+ start:417 stop:584 length:168 start_codon:yes stop_codon:yes gene_type:complete
MKTNINPIIYKQKNGSYLVIDWYKDQTYKQVYYGYTKRQAIRHFKNYYNKENEGE